MELELEKIKVLDDVVPKWLHQKAVETVPYLPLKWGHRGLGPSQGYLDHQLEKRRLMSWSITEEKRKENF